MEIYTRTWVFLSSASSFSLPLSYLVPKPLVILTRILRRQICHGGYNDDNKEDLRRKWVKLLGGSTGVRGKTQELRTTGLYFEKFK